MYNKCKCGQTLHMVFKNKAMCMNKDCKFFRIVFENDDFSTIQLSEKIFFVKFECENILTQNKKLVNLSDNDEIQRIQDCKMYQNTWVLYSQDFNKTIRGCYVGEFSIPNLDKK